MSSFKSKNALRNWMLAASTKEAIQLANAAGTTLGTLQQIAGGYRTEGRAATKPELAAKLEAASIVLTRKNLPPLRREDLCPACRRCDLAAAARSLEDADLV